MSSGAAPSIEYLASLAQQEIATARRIAQENLADVKKTVAPAVADLKKKIVEKVGGGSSLESLCDLCALPVVKNGPGVQAEIKRLLSLEQSLEADAAMLRNVSDTFKRLEQEIDQAPSVDQSEFANLGAASLKIAELLEQEKQHDARRAEMVAAEREATVVLPLDEG